MTPTSHLETLFKVIAQPLTRDYLRVKCNPNWANGSKKRRCVLRAFSLLISCFQFTIMHFFKVFHSWNNLTSNKKNPGQYENLWTRYRFNTYICYDCNLFFELNLVKGLYNIIMLSQKLFWSNSFYKQNF